MAGAGDLPAEEKEEAASPAGRSRPGPLPGRAPHHPPARPLPVRPEQRLPAVRLVLPPQPPLLQLGAGQPALRGGEAGDAAPSLLWRARPWRSTGGRWTCRWPPTGSCPRPSSPWRRPTTTSASRPGEGGGRRTGRRRGRRPRRWRATFSRWPPSPTSITRSASSRSCATTAWRAARRAPGAAHRAREDGRGAAAARAGVPGHPRGAPPARGDARVPDPLRRGRSRSRPGGEVRCGVRPGAGPADLAAGRLARPQRGDGGRGGARGAGAPAVGAGRRRGDRPGPRSGAEPLPRRGPQPGHPLQALPGPLPRPLHLPEEAEPHRRHPGPAPPHDARVAPHPGRPPDRRARLRHAGPGPARSCQWRRATGRSMARTWEGIRRFGGWGLRPSSPSTCCPTR